MTNPLALIVEDDPHQAELFTMALQAAEFETETIMDGIAALSRLTEIVPAVVVLDLHLPGVAGDKILHRIRADERLAETRVMLATADGEMAKSLRGESNLVLLKPISPSQLRALASRLRPSDTVME